MPWSRLILALMLLTLALPATAAEAPEAAKPAPAAVDSIAAPAESAGGGLWIRHPVDAAKKRVSGDGHTVHLNQSAPIYAQVLDGEGRPVAEQVVYFHQVSPKEQSLGNDLTDLEGIASVEFVAGKKEKSYTVIAQIPGEETGENRIIYHIPVRKKSWVLFMAFGLLGGLGLFLFGMNMMSNSLQRRAGGRMRAILGALTKNRFIGAAVGAFVTMVIQSSSATTVMMVSFVQAKLIGFAQTLGVNLGANVGTTVTAQLIAFKLTDYALLMIAIGFFMRVFAKRDGIRNWGDVVLGFGMLFYGMAVMSKAMYPLRSFPPFIDMLRGLENPLLGIVVGMIFTALIQSSSAFTGIVIVLAQQGFLTLEAGIPLIIGANIGTCITAGLASLGGSQDAKRVALAHTLFNVSGMLIFIGWIPIFADIVRSISPGGDTVITDTTAMARFIPRQVANAHTLFNVGVTLVFLPFTGVMARLVSRLMPDRVETGPVFTGRFLDPGMLGTPALALNLAKAEILRMGKRVKRMMDQSAKPFLDHDLEALSSIRDLEHEVDELDDQISAYLMEIGRQDISREQTEEVYMMMHVTKQFEHVADIINRELRPLARKMIQNDIRFSESGAGEVRAYHTKAAKQVSRSLAAFREGSLDKARRITKKQVKYARLEGTYRQAHFERIHGAITETLASSEIHLDLMDALRRINSYAANVARAMLDVESKREPDEASTALQNAALEDTNQGDPVPHRPPPSDNPPL